MQYFDNLCLQLPIETLYDSLVAWLRTFFVCRSELAGPAYFHSTGVSTRFYSKNGRHLAGNFSENLLRVTAALH